jgi:N-formylglutamate amidohydrolase
VRPDRPDVEIHAGHPASSVVIHVPHAAVRIPSDARVGIDLHDDALRHEAVRSADVGTDGLASSCVYGMHPTPWRVVNQVSRLVVDPERFIEHDSAERWGRGVVPALTTDGAKLRSADPTERVALIDRYHAPYSATVSSVVSRAIDDLKRCTVIDLHAYPRDPWPVEPDHRAPRPQICLGTDPFHTPDELVVAAERAFAAVGLETARNTPYAGTYVPQPFVGNDPRVSSLMIEVRKDVHLRDGLQTIDPRGAALVVKAMRSIVSYAEVLPLLPAFRRTVLTVTADDLHDGHVLTACAPWSRARPDDAEHTKALKASLQDEGLTTFDVDASEPATSDTDPGWSEPSLLIVGSDRFEVCRRGRELQQWAIFEIADGRLRIVLCANEEVVHEAPFVATRNGSTWVLREAS